MTEDRTNVWININKASELVGLSVQTLKKRCRKGDFVFKIVKRGKSSNYSLLLKSLPDFAQDKFLNEDIIDIKYSDAPIWAKEQAEKYLPILESTKHLKGKDLKEFSEKWNEENIENLSTSYSSVIKMRRRYFRYGLGGLLSKHSRHLKGSSVSNEYFDYFKIYTQLKEHHR